MGTVKKIILSSVVGGASFAVTLAIILAIYFWYQNKPKPPKPWNANAITATYDMIGTVGENNDVVFYYILQNNTDLDYNLPDLTNVTVMAKLKEQKSLSGQKKDELFKPDHPLLIPAKHRVRFFLNLEYPYDKSPKKNSSKEERAKHRQDLEFFFNKEFPNVDGLFYLMNLTGIKLNFLKVGK